MSTRVYTDNQLYVRILRAQRISERTVYVCMYIYIFFFSPPHYNIPPSLSPKNPIKITLRLNTGQPKGIKSGENLANYRMRLITVNRT
jgi:hypothetical protein